MKFWNFMKFYEILWNFRNFVNFMKFWKILKFKKKLNFRRFWNFEMFWKCSPFLYIFLPCDRLNYHPLSCDRLNWHTLLIQWEDRKFTWNILIRIVMHQSWLMPTKFRCLRFTYNGVDTSAGGLLVLDGIITTEVGASVLIRFIRYQFQIRSSIIR